jgi:DNA mismatch repair protein MutL
MPQDLADQIAAGEVVERPASAVKELVENAIDAAATRIEIDLQEGGLKSIRVADNGTGMFRDDAAMAIERHASSKLTEKAQLFNIQTLGFRGEALPSIASVSRFSLLTKPQGQLGGTRVVVTGGRDVTITDASSPPGTEIIVRDLFYNTPARLKFLKSVNTELRSILEIVERCALASPDIAFKVTHNDRKLLDYPAVNRMEDRLFSILGRDDAGMMYPLQPAEQDSVRASGWFGQPALHRRTATGIWVFVNGRFVRDKAITSAVRAAYEGLIDRSRYPVVVLRIEIPPRAVDVNVHPTKTEVRFHDPSAVFRAARRTFIQSLAACPWRPQSAAQSAAAGAAAAGAAAAGAAGSAPVTTTWGQGVRPAGSPASAGAPVQQSLPVRQYQMHSPDQRTAPVPAHVSPTGLSRPDWTTTGPAPAPRNRPWETPSQPLFNEDSADSAEFADIDGTTDDPANAAHAPGYFAALNYIGPFAGTYLLLSDGVELVVVDQHAAHERITYEQLRLSWQARRGTQQPLLVPRILTLDPMRAATMTDSLEFFETLGFSIEPFGDRDFALKAVPVIIGERGLDDLIRDSLDELGADGHSRRIDHSIDAVLIRMACHGSIRAGKRLSPQEVNALMHALDDIDFGANCPHGRPVWFKMSRAEIEKRFDRR